MKQEVVYNKPEDLSKEAKELSEVQKEAEYFSDKRKKEKTKEDRMLQMLQNEEKTKKYLTLKEDLMLQMLQNENEKEKKFAEIKNDSEFFNYILDIKLGITRPKLTESEKIFVNLKMLQMESEEQREKDKIEKDPASKMLQLKK